ncbi:cytochrome c oxidase subunit 7A2, mitochondrial-like [Clupea harengus]|uniref:Cytochrome c oxidase subunit 7A2, mitochondrial n=1 Tax=Clupea harengus TaxID=7950 RepID=A0A6P3WAH0_CLUHA|nr:cytochrome c oxidase subunit 7A2, mitochondrial-like [Clupea harengus]
MRIARKGTWDIIGSTVCVLVLDKLQLKSERQKMSYMYRHFTALQQISRRTIASSARRQVDNKVRQKQKLFQEDNGMPIHLKGGAKDALLYRATMGLTILGSAYVVYELLSAASPKKK